MSKTQLRFNLMNHNHVPKRGIKGDKQEVLRIPDVLVFNLPPQHSLGPELQKPSP